VENDALLRIKGELKVERLATNGNGGANGGNPDAEAEEDEQEVLKIFAHGLEKLEDYQGRGFSGALIKLPPGDCPPALFKALEAYRGSLPVYFDYQGRDGLTARVKAGPELKLRHDPDLAERLAKDLGCTLTWMY
jgi:DNA polymerase III subunit alpha